ncbi:MAG: 16S rRNA (cytosine(1402)-N(4))-methyltransferase RsmH [Sedimentisphaerales bacterium]|nr:16S rRNA (cytosine(1402)-N(4))-methyltransferase RsmH [Sedimentisphaerales bacterium]
MNTPSEHIPVLLETLAGQINLPPDGVMVDATIGQGGHSLLFGQTLGPEGVIIGFDVDNKSIQRAQLRLENLGCKVFLVRSNFSDVQEQLKTLGIKRVDFILADLGICSAQLADEQIGLSFLHDMPLDMRIDKRLKTTAADIINKANEKTLADIIYKYGQDRASRRIARFIVRHRQEKEIKTTGQLAAITCRALAGKGRKIRRRIHPATRTFQALRIAVNNELENLAKLLSTAPKLLAKKGCIAVISFHSLEDRLVKNDFRENKKKGVYEIITKKPIVPSREEIAANPRARSAKLRIAQKVIDN